jgi:hypothetical protein
VNATIVIASLVATVAIVLLLVAFGAQWIAGLWWLGRKWTRGWYKEW